MSRMRTQNYVPMQKHQGKKKKKKDRRKANFFEPSDRLKRRVKK